MVQNIKDFSKVKGVLYYESGNFRMEGEFILDEESGRYSANTSLFMPSDGPPDFCSRNRESSQCEKRTISGTVGYEICGGKIN